jgi:hypothetical protein
MRILSLHEEKSYLREAARVARANRTSTDGGIEVFDVWDSEESFQSFGETLVPIMSELGADPGEPQVAEIHNVILG